MSESRACALAIENFESHWNGNAPDEAGRLVVSRLPSWLQPKWAIGILDCVIYERPLRALCGRDFQLLEKLVYFGGHPKTWPKSCEIVPKLQRALRRADLHQTIHANLTGDQALVHELYQLGSVVAKLVCQASRGQEVDLDSGARIASSLKFFEDLWKDEGFSSRAWIALVCNNYGHHQEEARENWLAGESHEASRLIFENLEIANQPKWAFAMLRLVVERSRISFPPLQQLATIVEQPKKWHQAQRVFREIRDMLLGIEDSQTQQEMPEVTGCLVQIHEMAELVAKVTYNATNPKDPFDADSGWRIGPVLKYFVDYWHDKDFANAALSALCFEIDYRS